MRSTLVKAALTVIAFVMPLIALAHPGHEHTSSLASGFLHPMTGLDHLLAMFAIGLWASSIGGKALYTVPTAFVLAMVIGAVAAIAGLNIPFIEQGIVLSVIVLGTLVFGANRLPLAISITLAGVFAVFHGAAHGLEMPLNANGAQYAAGFALATIALHLVGVGFGRLITHLQIPSVTRIGGGAIALMGMLLAIG